MRLIRLARAALEAEGLYLRRIGRARGIQAAIAAAALVFVLMLLVMLHIAAFAALTDGRSVVGAALWVAAGDLVIAALLAFIASRSGHDPVAEEALMVRDAAMRQLSDGAARAAMLVPLMKSQSMKKGVIGAALTALAVGLFSRR